MDNDTIVNMDLNKLTEELSSHYSKIINSLLLQKVQLLAEVERLRRETKRFENEIKALMEELTKG